jgi:hypothetical protein
MHTYIVYCCGRKHTIKADSYGVGQYLKFYKGEEIVAQFTTFESMEVQS